MTAQNKLSAALTLLCIAIGLGIAVVSRAGSPPTEPPILGCYLLRDCLIG